METQKHIGNKTLDKLKVIYNNDIGIIDFLSDLQDRRGIGFLQKFIDDAKGDSGVLLLDELTDNIVVLILYKSPFGFNDPGNDFILYADNTLRDLAKYFKNQIDHTSEDAGEIYLALNDITRLLYREWANTEDNNTQTNFLG